MSSSSVHILGIGNLGKLIAHSLRTNHPELPITLLFHRRNLLDEWDQAGREIEIVRNGRPERRSGFQHELLDAATGGANEIRNLIVTTKTHTTVQAMAPLKERLGERSTLLFCQNGMGTVDEVTQKLFPKANSRPQYLTGIFNHGVYSTSTFASVHAGLANAFLGPVSADPTSTIDPNSPVPSLAEQIIACPELVTTFHSEQEILHIQFQKLTVNAVINPLSAIFDCFNGELFKSSPIRVIIDLMVAEISAVLLAVLAAKLGSLDAPVRERFSAGHLGKVVDDVGALTAKNISSMRQDALAGRKTEIDYINGYIVGQGHQHGISVPVNERVVALVQGRQKVTAGDALETFGISK